MTASFRRLNGAALVLPLVCGEDSHEEFSLSLVDCKLVCAADNLYFEVFNSFWSAWYWDQCDADFELIPIL